MTLAELLPKTFNEPEWVLERLKAFPENEWLTLNSDDYALFQELFHDHLVQSKTIPIWVNGSFKGRKILFRYNHQMQFDEK